MQVICLKSTSPKMGSHKAGQVLDLPEETVLGMPDFYRPVGDELAIEAAQKRALVVKAERAHEDRIAHKISMARAEAAPMAPARLRSANRTRVASASRSAAPVSTPRTTRSTPTCRRRAPRPCCPIGATS